MGSLQFKPTTFALLVLVELQELSWVPISRDVKLVFSTQARCGYATLGERSHIPLGIFLVTDTNYSTCCQFESLLSFTACDTPLVVCFKLTLVMSLDSHVYWNIKYKSL